MPVTIEEFNALSGTSFSQENFNRGFMTILANVPKEKYNDTFSKVYLGALKTAINTHIGTQKNIDVVKCMKSFDDMFKSSIDNYNEYAKQIDQALSLNDNESKTIGFLDNGGMNKTQIKKTVDDIILSGPSTEQESYKDKIKISASENLVWGTKEASTDDTLNINKAALRQVNTILDGQPQVIMFEGQPNQITVPINIDYSGKAPKSVNFGKNSKPLSYIEEFTSKEDKLHQSVQVVKAMEEIHSEHDKRFAQQHPIKNASEVKCINDMIAAIAAKGFSKAEFDKEYAKESPKVLFVKDYEEKVDAYLKNKETVKKEKQINLTKSLEKETSSINLEEKVEQKSIDKNLEKGIDDIKK